MPPFLDEFKSGKAPAPLAPFLDDFFANTDPPLLTKEVRFPSPVGEVLGYWTRPDVKQRLPAVLLVHDEDGLTDWMKLNARHFAGIGYEALMVNVQLCRRAAKPTPFTDEAALAELSAAVRWLRGRADVLPNRLGVVGWGWSGGQALALASATSVQACVVCDATLPTERGVIVGLRETPVLAVFAGASKSNQSGFAKLLAAEQIPGKLHKVDGVQPGFLGPPENKNYVHDAAEDAWVVIYNFLEKHVEDARPAMIEPANPVATIADIMRAVNEPTGLRGDAGAKQQEQRAGGRQTLAAYPEPMPRWLPKRASLVSITSAAQGTSGPLERASPGVHRRGQGNRPCRRSSARLSRGPAAASYAWRGSAACHQEHR